jgi:hypothetical protein
METLAENWFFVLVLLFCVGAHFLGHGHGCGHRRASEARREDGRDWKPDPEKFESPGE